MDERVARLIEGLDPAQRHAVTIEPGGPLAILAGAGSGKTTVLTRRVARRIATGDADASHTVVVTFTRRAARELTARLAALGVRDQLVCGTMHSVALGVLTQRWADTGQRPWKVLSRPTEVLAAVLDGVGRGVSSADVLADIDWARARMVAPERFEEAAAAARRRCAAAPARVAGWYGAYEQAKRSAHVADFNDLLSMCVTAAARDRAFAEVMKWRFRHLYVDEFQDLNPLQFELLRTWLSPRGDLCVVGDPHQAIYGWNGADPGLLDGFTDRFEGATVVYLDTNHRCPAPILTAAAAVLGGSRASARRPDGTAPNLVGFADETAEAAGIAELLRSARPPGGSWAAMAVLVRTHAQLPEIRRALEARRIPVTVRGQGTRLGPAARAWLVEPGHLRMPLGTAVTELEDRIDDPDLDPEHRGELAAVAAVARDFLAEQPLGTAAGLARWLDQGERSAEAERGGVELVTFHAAKGLEWSTVVVAGVESGLVPHGPANDAVRMAEERRLLYVAMTRARRELHLTWALSRNGTTRAPSPLLAPIRAAIAATAPGPATPVHLPRLATAGPSAPERVRQALQHWRADAARSARCAPAQILADEALERVAAHLPRTPAEVVASGGMSPVKAARFAPAVAAVVSSALEDRSAARPSGRPPG